MDKFSINGQKGFMEAATMTSLDPTSLLGIKGLGRRRYWLLGARLKSKSPFVDFLQL